MLLFKTFEHKEELKVCVRLVRGEGGRERN